MIDFQYVDVAPLNLSYITPWLEEVTVKEEKILGNLEIVLGSEQWLLEKNVQFLNHNFHTDVITFDYCVGNILSGDILISLDRVKDNAAHYDVSRETELNRVIVHGLLHLCGYNDATPEEAKEIHQKEDFYLSLL